MTQGFQHQQSAAGGFNIPRSVPTPQHGQKADLKDRATPLRQSRSFDPPPADRAHL